jgi:hypothetical protein
MREIDHQAKAKRITPDQLHEAIARSSPHLAYLLTPEKVAAIHAAIDHEGIEAEERAKIKVCEFLPGDHLPNGFDPREETKPAARSLYRHFLAGNRAMLILAEDGHIGFEPYHPGTFQALTTPQEVDQAACEHAGMLLTARVHQRVVIEAKKQLLS